MMTNQHFKQVGDHFPPTYPPTCPRAGWRCVRVLIGHATHPPTYPAASDVDGSFAAIHRPRPRKLLPEPPGILLWAIEGWHRLQEHGRFVQPDSGRELAGELEDLTSPVGVFIREARVPVRDAWPPAWIATMAETPAVIDPPAATAAVVDELAPWEKTPQSSELAAVVGKLLAPGVEPSKALVAICRCGSTRYIDVPIHNGQSMRRDCAKCRRFVSFPVWYAKHTKPRPNDGAQ
jgi:hypothetical protein